MRARTASGHAPHDAATLADALSHVAEVLRAPNACCAPHGDGGAWDVYLTPADRDADADGARPWLIVARITRVEVSP
jgi:hypothetical protein